MRFLCLAIFLFLTSCSNTVNNIDKTFYNESESYAISLYSLLSEKDVDVDYKKISQFLDQSPTNNDEKEILTLVTDLHNLSSLFIAQEIIGNNESKETKKQMQSIVETLESKYKMNIK